MAIGNQNLTEVSINQAETMPGMAHFAGTGPNGKTCGQCEFWGCQVMTSSGLKFQFRCKKYKELTRKNGAIIPGLTLACRYFEDRVEK